MVQSISFTAGWTLVRYKISELSENGQSDEQKALEIGFVLSGVFLLMIICFILQGWVANSHDHIISEFLTHGVIKEGLLIGLAQLGFLLFSSVQCAAEVQALSQNWKKCNRTLYSQTGLGTLISLYLGVKILSRLAPKNILDKHHVSMRSVFAMDLKVQGFVECFGLAIAACCALYMLGNYGAKGDFGDQTELGVMIVTMTVGCVSLLVTAAWKIAAIRGEIMQGEEDSGQERQYPPTIILTEASSFWFYASAVISACYSTINITHTVTMDKYFDALSKVYSSIVLWHLQSPYNANQGGEVRRTCGSCDFIS